MTRKEATEHDICAGGIQPSLRCNGMGRPPIIEKARPEAFPETNSTIARMLTLLPRLGETETALFLRTSVRDTDSEFNQPSNLLGSRPAASTNEVRISNLINIRPQPKSDASGVKAPSLAGFTAGLKSLCDYRKIGTSAAKAVLISLCLCRSPSILPPAGSQDELKLRPTKIPEFSHRL